MRAVWSSPKRSVIQLSCCVSACELCDCEKLMRNSQEPRRLPLVSELSTRDVREKHAAAATFQPARQPDRQTGNE